MESIIKEIRKKPLIIVALVIFILILGSVGALLSGSLTGTNSPKDAEIRIEKGSESINVYENGRVVVKRNGKEYVDFWDDEKYGAFKEYLEQNAATSNLFALSGFSILLNGQSYSLPEDDELIKTVIDETGGGGNEGAENGGETGQYFPTPTPTSGSGGSGGGSGGSSGGGSGGGSGGSSSGGTPSWCKLWRLSYCADPLPTKSPSPTPVPSVSAVPYVFDCGLGENLVTDRTVISNTLCIKTPTPTPTP